MTLLLTLLVLATPASAQTVETFAGRAPDSPYGVAVGPDGAVYYADYEHHRIRVMRPLPLPSGEPDDYGARTGPYSIETFAGTGEAGNLDGPAARAQFSHPRGVALGPDGALYVADHSPGSIRIIRSGRVETLARDHEWLEPAAIAVARDGTVYVADMGAGAVLAIRAGRVETVIDNWDEDHPAQGVVRPTALALGRDGSLFVTDGGLGRVSVFRRGRMRTLIGPDTQDGDESTPFYALTGIAIGRRGEVYVSDAGAHAVGIVRNGRVRPVVGNPGRPGFFDGSEDVAEVHQPHGLAIGPDGALYVADLANSSIRIWRHGEVEALGPEIESADGAALDARFWSPKAVATGPDGAVYFADMNGRVRVVRGGRVQTLAELDGAATGLAVARDGTVHAVVGDRVVRLRPGGLETVAEGLQYPSALAFGPDGALYIADTGHHRIAVVRGGRTETFAGDGQRGRRDGPAASAQFYSPEGIAVGPDGTVYVVEEGGVGVRIIRGGRVEAMRLDEELYAPRAIALASDGALYLVVGNRIVSIRRGRVVPVAGDMAGYSDEALGWDSRFRWPMGVAVAPDGTIYVADTGNDRICVLRP